MKHDPFIFLPYPRELKVLPGRFRLPENGTIWLNSRTADTFYPAAMRLKTKLTGRPGTSWGIKVGEPETGGGISFRIWPDEELHPQGYQMRIVEEGIWIDAGDATGAYYAICTLAQMLDQTPVDEHAIPCMSVRDWPDFPARGVQLDISRDKVYTMETLFQLVDLLSSWKINQFQLYTEHTFAYSNHRLVWQNASPMTPEEIRQLDAYCKERFVELVPNQNSFGHMERWLKHQPYVPLAEVTGEFITPWGERMAGPFGLAPLEPGSIDFLVSLYDELLPNFTSPLFNVGCDETFDLGKGKSKAACEELGTGRVYLDFLLKIYQLVNQRGKKMQFWGDIILKYPQYLNEIPRDVVGLIWGYEADHPFEYQAGLFANTGLQFYVCPGTSAWNSLSGRTDNALGNLKNAAVNGLRNGAAGYLITDWGDNGHWQMLPVSYLGLAAGAAYAWCTATNLERPVDAWLSCQVFQDNNEIMGRFVSDLGNADHADNLSLPGNGGYFWPLQWSLERIRQNTSYSPQMFSNGLHKIQQTRERDWGRDQMMRPDADLIRSEFELTMRMMSHACRRALFAFGEEDGAGLEADLDIILSEYRRIWFNRNRPGGLSDSLARLERLRDDYAG